MPVIAPMLTHPFFKEPLTKQSVAWRFTKLYHSKGWAYSCHTSSIESICSGDPGRYSQNRERVIAPNTQGTKTYGNANEIHLVVATPRFHNIVSSFLQ